MNAAGRAQLPAILGSFRSRLIGGVLAGCGAAALIVWSLAMRAGDADHPRKLDELRASAAAVAYPSPAGALPPSIRITDEGPGERTRMTLTLAPAVSARGFTLSALKLTLVSEFEGPARDPAKPELSVRCELSASSSGPGALAPAWPPAEFIADGATVEARVARKGESGYEADRTGERLKFKLMTVDLAKIAGARELSARVGVAELRFSSAQIADLREFLARMNPRAGAG